MFYLPVVVFLFILGTVVGSFINVLIDRLPRNESIRGRSYCDHCKIILKWYDLIPLLSFVYLKGRCRYCQKKISFQYPSVEVITGICYVGAYIFNQKQTADNISLIYFQILQISLISIFFIDLKDGVIPDKIVFPTLLLTVVYQIYLTSQLSDQLINLIQALLGSFVVAGLFLFLIVVTKGKGMGGGDVKLAFLVALISGWPKLILTIYLAFILGGVVAATLLIVKRKKFGETIPFGPFLIIGVYLSIIFYDQLRRLLWI